MKKVIVLLTLVSPFAFFFSCTHNPVLPDQQISFHNDIYPIILSSCQQSGCHDTLANETFSLISYDDMMHGNRIVPGKPKKSEIYQSVTTQTGDNFMPRSPYQPLSDIQIRKLYIWIAQGAKDN